MFGEWVPCDSVLRATFVRIQTIGKTRTTKDTAGYCRLARCEPLHKKDCRKGNYIIQDDIDKGSEMVVALIIVMAVVVFQM